VHQAGLERIPDPDGVLVGTISYMSPEQARGLNSKLDNRSDVFALGALLYAILTHRPPYTQKVLALRIVAAQKADVPPPQEVSAGSYLPPGLCRIAMKAMSLNPRDRYPDVNAFKEELERFLAGGFWFGTRSYSEGELIIRQGDLPDAAHVITSGVAEVFKTSEDGRKHVLRRMGPGDVFGETAILTDSRRSASVVAHTEVTTMIVTPDSLKEELAADSWMGAFVKALADRFRERDERLTQAAYAVEDARIIATIMKHMTFHGERVEEGVVRADWPPLSAMLTESFELGDAALIRVIERFGDHVRFDQERKYLWLRR
jgi:serine/threonine-protein kinase